MAVRVPEIGAAAAVLGMRGGAGGQRGGSFRLAARRAGGEEGEYDQQAAAPCQRDEDVMGGRAAEYQRPFG